MVPGRGGIVGIGKGRRVYAETSQTVEVRMRARRAKITLAAIDLIRAGSF